MKRIEVRIYSENEELPHLLEGNFFHSLELFQIGEKVPSDTPIMAVATQEGRVVGQMLAMIHRRHVLIPPFIYTHAHVHGEGVYLDEETAEADIPSTPNFQRYRKRCSATDISVARAITL